MSYSYFAGVVIVCCCREGGENVVKKQTSGNLALEQRRVIVIPAHDEIIARKLRVAAYARVSSSSEDQLNSYRVQNQYYDWAKIRFTSQFRPKLSLKKKDPATIQLGYDGTLEDVFTGFVSGNYDGGTYANEVALKDEMLLMEETIINDTFLDTTPQELISYFLAQATRRAKCSPFGGRPPSKRSTPSMRRGGFVFRSSSRAASSIGTRSRNRRRSTPSSAA